VRDLTGVWRSTPPSPEAIEERDRRLAAAAAQSPGAALAGDPPPGFSALERTPEPPKRDLEADRALAGRIANLRARMTAKARAANGTVAS
jgi:hypothetical protein